MQTGKNTALRRLGARLRGSALNRICSDGKPCSGVRGDQQVSTGREWLSVLLQIAAALFSDAVCTHFY